MGNAGLKRGEKGLKGPESGEKGPKMGQNGAEKGPRAECAALRWVQRGSEPTPPFKPTPTSLRSNFSRSGAAPFGSARPWSGRSRSWRGSGGTGAVPGGVRIPGGSEAGRC